ncbi:MAG TPA: carboxypeptidase regulatory-like domain-containing protein [Solirubrobacterales bacterium]|nr:carboxypeptidase regulatory-like domain-containing protein [Solirubrobacterales bacterium]
MPKTMFPSFSMLCLVLLACLGGRAPAQTHGEITGVITDASGATVPDVKVTVTNLATGAARLAQTNDAGVYSFPALFPGSYSLRVEKSGFRAIKQDGVELQVQQTARHDFTLEVGDVEQTVDVSGGATLLTTESTTVGTVIENKRIVDLPLNGRNFLQLVATAPNVSFGFQQAGQSGSRQGGTRANQQISVAGQRSYFNRFTIDGIENTDVNFNTPIILPSIDALQEFKVQTGVFPAEFGRASTQINVSTKSGTREYHGTVFEFLRNDVFDARIYDFTGKRAPDSPKEPLRWNQYGFTLGGPVWLPKEVFGPIGYDNRERVFFLTNFEGFRDRRTSRGRYQLPPAAWRTGDFSSLSNPIFDPLTGRQFPGNIIPQSRIHPTSLQLLEFYPSPNLAPASLGINHEQPQGRKIDKDQFIGRGDFIESTSSSWAGRYSWGDEVQLDPGLQLNGTKLLTTVKQVMASNTRTFSANKVNEVRFGYNSFFNSLGRELAGVRDVVSELDIPGVNPGPPISWGIPSIAVQGFSGFGDDTEGPYVNTNSTYQLVDNFSWTVGSHSFRFGGELRWDHYNQVGNQFARGGFLFEATATSNLGAAATGNGFADFLLGYCKRCEVSVSLADAQFRAFSQYYYFDDTWKLTPKLTLNLGLRYEYTPPWFDKTGRLVNIYVPFADRTPNVADLSRHPVFVRMGSGDFYEGLSLRFNPAIQVARDGRLGERLVDFDRNDFAPRFGLAWSPTSRWTVRLGGGVFYSQDTGNPRFDMARNLAGRRRDESTPTQLDLTWDAPFRNLGGTVQVNNPYVLGNIFARRTPYVIQYMLNVQRELGGNLLVEIGYLGSVARKLESLRAFNESIPGATGSVLSRAPYPEFGRIQEVDGSGKSSYNGLSFKVEKRFSAGLSFLAGYTWSRSIDNASAIRSHNGDTLFPQNSYNLAAEKALSSFHTSHRFVTSGTYELPFGDGKRWLDRGGFFNLLLGGWQVSPIVTVQTGFPLTVVSGRDQSNTGAGFDRPNVVSGQETHLPRGERSLDRWFNTAAYVLQPFGTHGTAGRNTLISPGFVQVDAALLKNFRIKEAVNVQFRFEAFNAPNHPNWGNPDTSVTSANYGRITGMRGLMRELQFGLKLLF